MKVHFYTLLTIAAALGGPALSPALGVEEAPASARLETDRLEPAQQRQLEHLLDDLRDPNLELERRQRAALILLDWNMPNMDGLTFLKTFRKSNPATLVIMVTTEAEKTRVIEAIKAGVNNCVVKPFMPDVLGARIDETLKKAG